MDTTGAFLHSTIGRYQILERIGSGGMARVYRGYDTNLDREVAIKVLHEHLSDDSKFLERFKREAKFVAAFNNPNIVQVYDFDTIERDGIHIAYMVMSFIPGQTLQEVLRGINEREEIMPRDRALAILTDLCNALSYAHERGMVHRDVKPANILFNERGQAVLTDFGIARMAENSNLTQEGVTVGTPAYMSPEQATGQEIDHRSDIYALGIIAYEILAGQPPFADDGSLSVLLKHLHEQPPSLSQYPHIDNPYLDAVIQQALAKLPEDRYQNVTDFAEDLKTAFSGQLPETRPARQSQSGMTTTVTAPFPVLAPEETTSSRTSKRVLSRSPLGIFTVGITVIALLLFAGLLTQQSSDASNTTTGTESVDNEVDGVSAMTEMPVYFSTQFEVGETYTQYWPQGESNGLSREILPDGGYRIENLRENQAISSIFEPGADYGDLVIQLEATLDPDSSPASGYGIIFRYVDENNYNVFAVDGLGRYSIWILEDGDWTELRAGDETWTRSDAINRIGERNALRVEIADDVLTGYANGQEVTSVVDDTFSTGKVGVYMASTSESNTTVLFESYEVTELIDEMTGVDSMTCEGLGRCLDDPITDSMTDEED